MPDPTFISVADQIPFDWHSFFWGGAVGSFAGAFIILTLERLIDSIFNTIKFRAEKKQITKAFEDELNFNLKLCESTIVTLKKVRTSWPDFAKFHTIWLEKFDYRYIDFTNEDSLRLHWYLWDSRALIEQVESLAFKATFIQIAMRGSQLDPEVATTNNQNILKLVQELKVVLIAVKKLRKDSKIFKEDVDTLFGMPTV